MDSEYQTEMIYAQILQQELGLPSISVSRFNPRAVRRQPLLDFLRLQPYDKIVLIGSAELETLQFPVYLRNSGKWLLVSRSELSQLIDDPSDPR